DVRRAMCQMCWLNIRVSAAAVHHNLDASVLRPAFRIVRAVSLRVRRDRSGSAPALRSKPRRIAGAVSYEPLRDGGGASFGERLVVGVSPLCVRMAFDVDRRVGIGLDDRDELA